jgi:hypothetical protein
MLDADVATHRRHFHTPDQQVLVNKPKHSRCTTSITATPPPPSPPPMRRPASHPSRASVPAEQRVAA